MKLTPYATLSLVASAFAALGGYFVVGYWQILLINLAAMLFGLGLGMTVINHLLCRKEKRAAALPMLEMIEPYISELHTGHLIEPGRLKFGISGFTALLDAYEKKGRRSEALSPEQQNGLYELIREHRAKALPLMNSIHDQLREMNSLLDWSVSPRILTVSLRARLTIVRFKALELDDLEKTKLRACELYLDVDRTCGGILSEITSLLDLPTDRQPSDYTG